MTPERLRQVANVLDVALELEESMRPSYLAALGSQDPDLQRQVETHLKRLSDQERGVSPEGEHDDAQPPTTSNDQAASMLSGTEIGESLGPYRIIEHLGVGGMGTVFLAERDDQQFQRRVAIKILRSGFDSPELIRRFVAERQILAQLEHANIARLYEGGATPDGRPYLVMEYVDGRPIDRYCDEEKLSIQDRIEVIHKVCAAVQYAHRHLIVHRDLKPSNILVNASGEPKLLDFGIAKLLDPENFPMTIEPTRTGLSPMTPHFASPEQVRGESITTSTDVYALGVLLYRLLAGRLPYHFASGTRNHILQVLERSGPTRPSLVILEDAEKDLEPRPLPLLLGLAPSELQRQLSGDLDSIVLKALRPESEHRYSSPEQLALDLERHMNGLPVHARQGTWRYRVGKFARRHRFGVALAAAAVLILTTLSIFMTWQAAQIATERNAALAARDEAQIAQHAEAQVVEFLTGLFNTADPRQARGEEVTARQLLDRGAVKVRNELSDAPAVQSRLLLTIAKVFHQLSLYKEAVDLANESATLRQRGGAKAEDVAESRLTVATSQIMLGLLDEAAQGLDEVESMIELEAEPRVEAIIASSRGLIALHRGQFQEAVEHYERSLAVKGTSLDYSAIARSFSNQAFAFEQLSRPEEAEAKYLESLRIAREHFGEDHPLVGNALNNLGACVKDQGRVEEAQEYYRQALELRIRVMGEDHLETAQTRANMAILDADEGRWRQAVPAFLQTIESFQRHLGENHPHVAMAWNNLGQCYRQLGEHRSAADALARGLEAMTASVGEDHPIVAQNLLQQSALHIDLNRPAEGASLFERIETILTNSVGQSHGFFIALQKARCRLQVRKKHPDAVTVCQDVLRAARETYGDSHRSLIDASAFLVQALVAQKDLVTAKAQLETAEAAASSTSDQHPARIPLLIARGDLHRSLGEKDLAATTYRRAIELADLAELTEAHPDRLEAQRGLAAAEEL